MALKQNQPKIGTQHGVSENKTARTGRDSFLKASGSVGHPHGVSVNQVARTGRDAGIGPVGPVRGIGRGKADSGSSGGVKGIPDGVGGPLPTP